MQSRSVIHLIPYDGVGGVEEAARSLSHTALPGIDFRVEYLFPKVKSRIDRLQTFDPTQIMKSVAALIRMAPDVLILSLWRSVAAGLIVKLFRPKTQLVLFLHNARDAHFADRFLTRLGARFASAIWADSMATLAERLPKPVSVPTRVLSFVLRKTTPKTTLRRDDKPNPVFAFWGRFSPQKNIPRAMRLFLQIQKRVPQAQLILIGATSTEIPAWRERIRALGLEESVSIHEVMTFEEIIGIATSASFYLQTSQYEGMAISVVEAMQLGLVPVVTPVGQIAQYCRDSENAVLVPVEAEDHEAETQTVNRVISLLSDDGQAWRRLRLAAISEWKNASTYRESFVTALANLGQE